jgi:hypothetical protein
MTDARRAYEKARDKTPKGRLRRYKDNAKRHKRAFQLSLEQFSRLLSGRCFYCNKTENIGIDRLDPSMGYELGNVVPCCEDCNYMKQSMSVERFLRQCEKVAARTAVIIQELRTV